MADAVESSNVVGYKTATVAKGNNKAFSLNLSKVGSAEAGVKINELFTIDAISAIAAWGDGMDQVWRWDATVNKWAKYGYHQNPRGNPALAPAWRKYDSATGTFAELTDDDVVLPGETFLFYRGGNATATLTLAGQVNEFTATKSYSIAKGYNQFVAYPWPVEIKLSELPNIATFSSIAAIAAWGDGMDQIWRWDTTVNKWAKYGYHQNPRGNPALPAAWRKYDASTGTFSELTDDDKSLADEGFLYYRGGNATLTLTFNSLQAAE